MPHDPSMPSSQTQDFLIQGLEPEPFSALFTLDDGELEALGARRVPVTSKPGFPCRVSLRDAEVGETVILLHYAHHEVESPYRASGPIYVREGVESARLSAGEIPEVVGGRSISLRAYSAKGMMRNAAVCDGADLGPEIERLFADPKVAYLHAHNALPGCFSCRVERAG